jgi:hypothetical protein
MPERLDPRGDLEDGLGVLELGEVQRAPRHGLELEREAA